MTTINNTQSKAAKKLTVSKETIRLLTGVPAVNRWGPVTLTCSYVPMSPTKTNG